MKTIAGYFALLLAAMPVGCVLAADPAPAPAPLTREDVQTWLAGLMPYALNTADVAGAVVVVVKDGAVLFEGGYGFADVEKQRPVDPRTTLFRPGSTSKLFTWTAVMQQVQAGRIDLDADINRYLDFRIPAYEGKPVTMRQIMTHTAGFEEAIKGLISEDKQVPPLGTVVKRWVPERIFPPGVTPAYSNYAVALAGYIVERVSGEPFDDYIDHHVFGPLGMSHSTFREPLPAALAADMSQGYALASQPAKPFEMITVRPAGSASVSGDDMARFMLAHLDESAGVLLKPDVAHQMHTRALTLLPPLNRMKLGFYEGNLDGEDIIGHGGDTQWFHSDLWLLPERHVGLFVSINSAGTGPASLTIRESLIGAFVARYFPPAAAASDFKPRTGDAAAAAGTYEASRRSQSGLRRALNFFSQKTLSVDASGELTSADFEFAGLNGAPRRWVEIAPYVWKDRSSSERLAAQLRDGRVVRVAVDSFSPFEVYDRVPWYASTAWLRPAGIASALVLLGVVLSVAAGWLARRYYGAARRLSAGERRAYVATASLSLATLVILGSWLTLILGLRFQPLGVGTYLLQVATLLILPALCIASIWLLRSGQRMRRGRLSAALRVAVVLAAVCTLWTAVAFNLTHLGIGY
jgi:CubicO group peptidase (beta-lactamase class C family)